VGLGRRNIFYGVGWRGQRVAPAWRHPLATTCEPARGGNPEEGGTWFAFGQGVPPAGAKRRWGMAVLMPHDPVGAEYRTST